MAQLHSSARTLKSGLEYKARGEAPTATVSVQQKKTNVGQTWSYLATRSNSVVHVRRHTIGEGL